MRGQNVKALGRLLEEANAALGDTRRPLIGDCGRLAEWLVEVGAVLVPSIVTDEEALDLLQKLPALISAGTTEEVEGQWLREGLHRIAAHTPAEGGEAVLRGTHRWGVSVP